MSSRISPKRSKSPESKVKLEEEPQPPPIPARYLTRPRSPEKKEPLTRGRSPPPVYSPVRGKSQSPPNSPVRGKSPPPAYASLKASPERKASPVPNRPTVKLNPDAKSFNLSPQAQPIVFTSITHIGDTGYVRNLNDLNWGVKIFRDDLMKLYYFDKEMKQKVIINESTSIKRLLEKNKIVHYSQMYNPNLVRCEVYQTFDYPSTGFRVVSYGNANGRIIYQGPRGGTFYFSMGGNKKYISNQDDKKSI
jgi:hypothetical protein